MIEVVGNNTRSVGVWRLSEILAEIPIYLRCLSRVSLLPPLVQSGRRCMQRQNPKLVVAEHRLAEAGRIVAGQRALIENRNYRPSMPNDHFRCISVRQRTFWLTSVSSKKTSRTPKLSPTETSGEKNHIAERIFQPTSPRSRSSIRYACPVLSLTMKQASVSSTDPAAGSGGLLQGTTPDPRQAVTVMSAVRAKADTTQT